MKNSQRHIDMTVEQVDGFLFRARFDKDQYPEIQLDQPFPLGHDAGPNAVRLLAAAIGNCVASNFLFYAQHNGINLCGLKAKIHVELARNTDQRFRVVHLDVALDAPGVDVAAIAASMPSFEDFCLVTQSVRAGIPIDVHYGTLGSGQVAREFRN